MKLAWDGFRKQLSAGMLSRAFCIKEPPIEWLLSVSKTGITVYATIATLNFLVRSLSVLNLGYYWNFFTMFALSASHVIMYYINAGHLFGDSARMRHYALAMTFTLAVIGGVWSCVYITNPVYRHRGMGMAVVLWRVLVPAFGLRKSQCMGILSVGTVSEIIATVSSARFFGEMLGIHRVLTMLIISSLLTLGWCYVWISWRYDVFKLLKRMEIEMEASQSILTMVCDATFWVADDGETLVSSDHRLEALLGKCLKGRLLSDFMPEKERDRFRELVQQKNSTHTRQVPITLTCPQISSASISADLLIVDRRDSLEEDSEVKFQHARDPTGIASHLQACFLIGLRVGSETEQATHGSELAIEAISEASTETAAKVDELASMVRKSSSAFDYQPLPVGLNNEREPPLMFDVCSQVLCHESDGSYQLRDILQVHTGTMLVCVDCFDYELCTEMVEDISMETNGFCMQFSDRCQVPVQSKLISKRTRDAFQKWRSVHRLAASPNVVVQYLFFDHVASLSGRSCSWDTLKTNGHKWSNHLMRMRLAKGSRSVLMSMGAGRFVAVGAPSQVRFEAGSDARSSLGTESSLNLPEYPQDQSKKQLLSLGGWDATGSYFEHCASSLLEDIVEAANFSGHACCMWHLSLQKLSAMIDSLLARKCKMERNQLMIQCAQCGALSPPEDEEETCWLCQQQRASVAETSDSGISLRQRRLGACV